jgi:hypothetical protein
VFGFIAEPCRRERDGVGVPAFSRSRATAGRTLAEAGDRCRRRGHRLPTRQNGAEHATLRWFRTWRQCRPSVASPAGAWTHGRKPSWTSGG